MEKKVYLDEKILRKREAKLKEKYATLGSGIYLQGNIMTFKREMIHELFSMMIPTDFDIMPEQLAHVKYPSVFRPQYLLTSEDLTINMGFSVFLDHLQTTDPGQVAQRVKQTLQNESDAFHFSEITPIKNVEGHYFDFRQHTMDSEIFQMMALIRMNQKLHQLSFNCLFSSCQDWKPIVLQLWDSIEYEQKG